MYPCLVTNLPVYTQLRTKNPDAIEGKHSNRKFINCQRPVPLIKCNASSQSNCISGLEVGCGMHRLKNFIFESEFLLHVINSPNLFPVWKDVYFGNRQQYIYTILLQVIRQITFNIITISIFDIKYVDLMNDSIILANKNSMMLKIHEYTRCQTIQGHPIKMRKIKVKKENG